MERTLASALDDERYGRATNVSLDNRLHAERVTNAQQIDLSGYTRYPKEYDQHLRVNGSSKFKESVHREPELWYHAIWEMHKQLKFASLQGLHLRQKNDELLFAVVALESRQVSEYLRSASS